jgi:hypothetical protein
MYYKSNTLIGGREPQAQGCGKTYGPFIGYFLNVKAGSLYYAFGIMGNYYAPIKFSASAIVCACFLSSIVV